MNKTLLTGLVALAFTTLTARAQTTAFTYHGVLRSGPTKAQASGNHDFEFTIYDAATGNTVVGATITRLNVPVDNGLFTVNLEFGGAVFSGDPRWLQVAVRASGAGTMATLSPRQEITSIPYAYKADTADTAENVSGAVPASQITGELPATAFPTGSIELGKLSDTVIYNTFWRLGGNAGTTAGNFLGTTDNQPLELRVSGTRVLRLENGGAGVNLIVGSGLNSITGSGDSAVLGGRDNDILGNSDFSVISGGSQNQIQANAAASTIGGGSLNVIWPGATYATISGGYSQNIHDGSSNSFIGGGSANLISSNASGAVIGGGIGNRIEFLSANATITGGQGNTISNNSTDAVIGGGSVNQIRSESEFSTIAGGGDNRIGTNSPSSVISGGGLNRIAANSRAATIGGGQSSEIGANAIYTVIGGGDNNLILANANHATIAGGLRNTVGTNADYGAIGGGESNWIGDNSYDATIAGGNSNEIGTNAYQSVIGGGFDNTIAANATRATIAGGYRNTVSTNADYGAIGGGEGNRIGNDSTDAVIAGGSSNDIGTNSGNSVISGGLDNNIAGDSSVAAIAGGRFNDIFLGSDHSAIGGGFDNGIGPNTIEAFIAGGHRNQIQARAESATIGGGYFNKVGTNSLQSTIGGGFDNTILAEGQYATIPGGFQNTATNFAFAAGRRAKANHTGTFVWADAQNADFASTSNHQFLIRASGGVGIGTNNPQSALHVRGIVTADGFAGDGSGLSNLTSIAIVTNIITDPTVARLNTNQTFTASNTFSGVTVATNGANQLGGQFTGAVSGNGAGLTNLNFGGSGAATTASRSDHTHAASNIVSGTLDDLRLSTNVALLSGSQTFSGAKAMTNVGNTFVGTFSGNGAGLTNLNLGSLGGGIAYWGSNQTFTASNVFSGVVTMTNATNILVGNFTGNGAGVTNLNAGNLASGIVPDARLSNNVARLNVSQTFTGTNTFNPAAGPPFLVGNTTKVPSLNADLLDGLDSSAFASNVHVHAASDITSGILNDLRLSGNVALRTNQNTFLAANTFSGVVIATNVANQFAGAFLGTFFGNGAGLTNLPNFAATNAWNLAGNAGTSPTINFLGTTDGQPLILKAAGGVGIGTTNPSAPLTVIGARAGSYTTPVVYIENTNVAGNSSPALRLASSGNTADGVLNVSAFGTGKIAAFGANPFGEVVNLDTNGSFFFDPRTRQMLNLWGTLYGIGVQNFTLYARSDGGFAWFNKGTHANSQNDAGAGGTTLMSLSSSGDLSVLGAINVGSYSGNGAGLSGLWKTSGNAGTTSADFIGTTDNQALQLKVNGARAFRLEPNANSPNVIGGFAGNRVDGGAFGASIAGGGRSGNTNLVSANFGTVGGGERNLAGGVYATVAGGWSNAAVGVSLATIAGGGHNIASALEATVGGGSFNLASGTFSTVAGGEANEALEGSAIAGGYANYAGTNSFVGGGYRNSASGYGAVVGGGGGFNPETGTYNSNRASGYFSSVGGGWGNLADGAYANVSGGFWNTSSVYASTIGGGYGNTSSGLGATVSGGGVNNSIGLNATVGGGNGNRATSNYATVAGGTSNKATNSNATVAGGRLNLAGGLSATIPGGDGNTAYASYSTVGGGLNNTIFPTATAATVGGGEYNAAGPDAWFASIGGGTENQVGSSAQWATIPGGQQNLVNGSWSLAAGLQAQANHQGCFVWADSQNIPLASTSNNQFLVRASGGVGIGLNNPAAQLEVSSGGGDSFPQARINQTNAADYARLRFTVGSDYNKRWDVGTRSNVFAIYSGQFSAEMLRLDNTGLTVNGTFVSASDRNLKENLRPVDSKVVLEKVAALPLAEWNYKQDGHSRHLGPMAQDFQAAFGLGADDKHIATVDADGVALAAIQGLNQKFEETRAENAELRQTVSELKELVQAMNQKLNGGAK